MDFNSLSSMSGKSSMKRKVRLLTSSQSNFELMIPSSNPMCVARGIFVRESDELKSLLQALGKNHSRTSAIPITPTYPTTTPPTSISSTFPDSSITDPYSHESPFWPDSASSAYRAGSSSYHLPSHGSRSVSGSTLIGSGGGGGEERKEKIGTSSSQMIKRPEDVFRIVKERLFSWSYMMQWYQGYVPSSIPFFGLN